MSQDVGSKLIACRVCGVIMVQLARDACSKCFVVEESVFQKVKEYLKINEGASILEVSKSVGCLVEQVEYFVRAGRLERLGIKIAHPCQICQKIILEGIICGECKRVLKEQVDSLQEKISEEDAKNQSSEDRPDLDSSEDDADADTS